MLGSRGGGKCRELKLLCLFWPQLDELASLRAELEDERARREAAARAALHARCVAARRATDASGHAVARVAAVREEFDNVRELCARCQELLGAFSEPPRRAASSRPDGGRYSSSWGRGARWS